MNHAKCPWCLKQTQLIVSYSSELQGKARIVCSECSTSGPFGTGEGGAWHEWDKRVTLHDEIKRLDLQEFRDLGLLQEVNRQFFHPRGLALEIIVSDLDSNLVVSLGGIWDHRTDPDGMFYGNLDQAKIASVEALRLSFLNHRLNTGLCDGDGLQIHGMLE